MDPATRQPKGFGYVEFEDAMSLKAAVEMDGESVLNRRIRVNVAEGGTFF
jgi:RNA recognition motif-containing protein